MRWTPEATDEAAHPRGPMPERQTPVIEVDARVRLPPERAMPSALGRNQAKWREAGALE